MNIFVESWKDAQSDHCWLDENSCEQDYVEDSTCYGCGHTMEVISEVLNSKGEVGLVSGLCPSCGYVKRIRNLSDSWYINHFSRNWLKKRVNEQVVEDRYPFELLAPLMENKGRVLDVGCGIGTRLIPFKKAGFDVYGVEPSEKRSSTASSILGNVETTTGEDYFSNCSRSFDLIYFFDVLQFIKNPFKLLTHAAEKLGQGGLIYIHAGTFYLDHNFCQFSHIGVLQSFLSLYSLKKLFSDLNLSVALYSERPFEIVLRKGQVEGRSKNILESSKKLTKRDLEKFARKTLKMYRLRIFRKAKLKLHFRGREVTIRIKGHFDKHLPISFIHNTSKLPILLK